MSTNLRRIAAASLCASLMFAAPARAQTETGGAQALANCAGAVAAYGNIQIMSFPRGASGAWATVLGAVLTRMNREPGLEGMTGRVAADAARQYWASQPRAAQETAVRECQARFGTP